MNTEKRKAKIHEWIVLTNVDLIDQEEYGLKKGDILQVLAQGPNGNGVLAALSRPVKGCPGIYPIFHDDYEVIVDEIDEAEMFFKYMFGDDN